MRKGTFVALVSLFLGVGLAHGKALPRSAPEQAPASPPATLLPPAQAIVAPAPAPAADNPPAGDSLPPGAAWFADRLGCFFCAEPGRERRGEFTAAAEYVLWFPADRRDSRPLAATDVFGQPTTRVLATTSDERLERHLTSGGRFTLGYWQAEENPWVPGHELRTFGAETRFFFVGQRSVDSRDGTAPILVRPFFDLNNRRESAVVVAAPGLATGEIGSHASMDLWGGEVNLWRILYYDDPGTTFSVHAMAGFRYVDLDLDVAITRTSAFNTNLGAFPAFVSLAGNRIQESESFAARNHFYGGQVGLALRAYLDLFTVEGLVKVAVGTTREEINIAGSQVRTTANGTATVFPGALLALPSNIGQVSRNKFAQVPELGLNVLVPVLPHVTLTGGFSALFWSRIVRAGEQIDRTIDVTQIPNFPGAAGAVPTGLQRPAVPFEQSSLWLLGMTFGVEISW